MPKLKTHKGSSKVFKKRKNATKLMIAFFRWIKDNRKKKQNVRLLALSTFHI